MSALDQARLAAQQDMPDLQRDKINPHFGSSFLSLEALMGTLLPVLNKHGLVLGQWPTTVDGHPALRTKLTHAESGESEEDTMLLVMAKNDPQGQGSAITYARRYAAMSALALVADADDDANAAGGKPARAVARSGAAGRSASAPTTTAAAAGGGEALVTSPPTPPSTTTLGPGAVVLSFGKYKGQTIAQVGVGDRQYVHWLSDKAERGDVKAAATAWLRETA